MQTDYLTGRLTVLYDIDVVQLNHTVNGRTSYMFLTEGDQIEVKEEGEWKRVSISEIFETTVNNKDEWNYGKSYYRDAYARVRLSEDGNKFINSLERRYKINEVLHYLKHGKLSQREAADVLLKIELEDV